MIIIEDNHNRKVQNPKNGGFVYMDGVEIINFALNEVHDLIKNFLTENGFNSSDITLYACHQANKVILDSLADKLEVPREKVPFTSADIGNESSGSIPLVLTAMKDKIDLSRVLCAGFGVGLSIGLCIADFSKTTFYGVLELE